MAKWITLTDWKVVSTGSPPGTTNIYAIDSWVDQRELYINLPYSAVIGNSILLRLSGSSTIFSGANFTGADIFFYGLANIVDLNNLTWANKPSGTQMPQITKQISGELSLCNVTGTLDGNNFLGLHRLSIGSSAIRVQCGAFFDVSPDIPLGPRWLRVDFTTIEMIDTPILDTF